jgi:hypothetical protein
MSSTFPLIKSESHACYIFWRGDPSFENFALLFRTESMAKKWHKELLRLKKRNDLLPASKNQGSTSFGNFSTEIKVPYISDTTD